MANVRATIPWDVFKGKIEMADDFDDPLEEFEDSLNEPLPPITDAPTSLI